jgi:hypothetical protein
MVKRIIPLVLAVCSICAVMAMYWNTGTLWHNQYDDSYITYRYAVNLAEHGQLVFNLGERTDAASSFLYTVILAAFYRIGLHNLEMVSFLLNMLAVGAIAAFVYLCAFRLSRNRWGSAALGMIAATHGFISGWAILGMDAVPFAALLCALAWAIFERRDTLSFALVIAVVLMRPEGVLAVPCWWWATGRKVRDGVLVAGLIALYYGARWTYYGTPFGHALAAKQVSLYYYSQPMKIIAAWRTFALTASIIALIGAYTDKRVRWLAGYIILAAVACLLGPNSDWCRYAVPLFPLCLIAGSPSFRRTGYIFVVCVVLMSQGYDSYRWMYYQAKNLAPVQQARAEAGRWLEKNASAEFEFIPADISIPSIRRPLVNGQIPYNFTHGGGAAHIIPGPWVLSGDIGAIAYFAPDVRFIDTIGLTSRDVLAAYQRGENLDAIIKARRPRYVADTFEIKDGSLLYTHGNGAFIKGGKPSYIPPMRLIWGRQVSPTLAIVIAEIQNSKEGAAK